jgi:hypothetical protein
VVFGVVVFSWIASSLKFCFLVVGIAAAVLLFGSQRLRKPPGTASSSASIPGYEIEHPMAVVILGGLVTSTLLSLFVVPVLYLRFRSGSVHASDGLLAQKGSSQEALRRRNHAT